MTFYTAVIWKITLVTLFEYNLQNQLIKTTKDGQTTEYKYDPLGRRIEKKDGFGTTRYLWAGDQLAQETRNNIKKTYVYEPLSFKPVALVQDDEVYHYHLDHLGTPRELTNNEGNIVWKVRYKTWGNVALKECEEIENNIRFQGQYFDEETGLHYNRHRYYNPDTGQFISQDPIGLLGGVNNYQYAPNPIGWIDPLGLCKDAINTGTNLDPGNPLSTSFPRSSNRLVVDQSTFPVLPNVACGPTSCVMVLDTLGQVASPQVLAQQSSLGMNGTTVVGLQKALFDNGIADARYTLTASIDDLELATSQGYPAIAHIDVRGGHFVVVDGITERSANDVVAVRDPALGREYFVPKNEFIAKLTGNVVFTNP